MYEIFSRLDTVSYDEIFDPRVIRTFTCLWTSSSVLGESICVRPEVVCTPVGTSCGFGVHTESIITVRMVRLRMKGFLTIGSSLPPYLSHNTGRPRGTT